jgi:hypothetical protein
MISSLGSREDSLHGSTDEAVWRQPSCISHVTNRRSDAIVLTYRFRTRMDSLWTQSEPVRLGVGSLHSVWRLLICVIIRARGQDRAGSLGF